MTSELRLPATLLKQPSAYSKKFKKQPASTAAGANSPVSSSPSHSLARKPPPPAPVVSAAQPPVAPNKPDPAQLRALSAHRPSPLGPPRPSLPPQALASLDLTPPV
ncbi:hypothetical protein PtA15_6A636 [Puccinia triticina]|uniref:Uncharacterized protein n=1 Tax=Puccinia triticina TaxID=208348 RepID=A0ABY7CPF1_9BASI|nr:uncharacterized protein PtA15_6A636 [Puccinia triticina]WAQ86006.1 hypothetical protein PtA15_6A636 [Puccinia triticina]